jgi:Leucyl-tRNA synthetase
MDYNHKKIEKKWQELWDKTKLFALRNQKIRKMLCA